MEIPDRKNYRFIVEIIKVTFPDGKRRTVPTVFYDIEGQTFFPNQKLIKEVLSEVDLEYSNLLSKYRGSNNNLNELLNDFFEKISKYAIIKGETIRTLSEDLQLRPNKIKQEIFKTKWYNNLIENIVRDFRKGNKKDPILYAESIRQLVELVGKSEASKLLENKGVKIGRSALDGLCRVGGEVPRIKELIRNGDLKLTLVWELPRVREDARVKIAESLVGLKYNEAKEKLKKIKRTLAKKY